MYFPVDGDRDFFLRIASPATEIHIPEIYGCTDNDYRDGIHVVPRKGILSHALRFDEKEMFNLGVGSKSESRTGRIISLQRIRLSFELSVLQEPVEVVLVVG